VRHILGCATFIVGMVPPANLDDLSHTELKSLVVALFEQVAELRRTIAAQAEEIARLKGGPRRPNIKPSGMEKATEPKPDKPGGEGHGKRGSAKSKLTIHEEKTVKADAPAGSRFKGYTELPGAGSGGPCACYQFPLSAPGFAPITRRTSKRLKTLATPPGFEPGTLSLEGAWSRNDFNARSDIFTVRAPFDAIAEFRFVGTPTSRPLAATQRALTSRPTNSSAWWKYVVTPVRRSRILNRELTDAEMTTRPRR
jgi:hypothetical protein